LAECTLAGPIPRPSSELWRSLGFNSIEALLQFWEQDHLTQDANNLLTVLDTWQRGDISDNPVFKGNYNSALNAITMPTRVMPSATDLYFTAEDARQDARQMPGAAFDALTSDWGHIAGGARREPQSHQKILAAAQSLLSEIEP
jgi:homoserine O-acetyltransferase